MPSICGKRTLLWLATLPSCKCCCVAFVNKQFYSVCISTYAWGSAILICKQWKPWGTVGCPREEKYKFLTHYFLINSFYRHPSEAHLCVNPVRKDERVGAARWNSIRQIIYNLYQYNEKNNARWGFNYPFHAINVRDNFRSAITTLLKIRLILISRTC